MCALRIDFLSALPDSFSSVLNTGIIRIAKERGLVEFNIHNLHDYSDNKFGHIDDTPYGGGACMLIKCQPIFDCINKLKNERKYDEIYPILGFRIMLKMTAPLNVQLIQYSKCNCN